MSPAWHALRPGEVLHRLGSSTAGLADAEAAQRLARHGRNVFRSAPSVSAWTVLASQFRSIIVLLLIAAAAIALLTGDALDAIAISLVLILNVAIGFVTELRAHRAMEAILTLEVSRALVLRGGLLRDHDARDLVPGDIIELEAGQSVPADARLLESPELRIVEAALTGESATVDKDAHATLVVDTPLPDRRNMLFKTTSIVAGRGRAVVVATGMDTEVGRIGTLAGAVRREPTPLERRLDALGGRLVGVAVAVAAIVALVGVGQRRSWTELVQTAIALAVAAVPEGLPVVGTIAMAVGTWRMARRRALVRRLPVVESLGSATVICTDKTGTLTSGDMTLMAITFPEREVLVSGTGYAPVGGFSAEGHPIEPGKDEQLLTALRIASLASRGDVVFENEVWRAQGDPTEAALAAGARKAGIDRTQLLDRWPQVAEMPFSSERMLTATFHQTPAGLLGYVKGAPGKILELCTKVLTADGVRELRPGEREELLDQNHALAARGLRVLALAMKQGKGALVGDLSGLTYVGLAGLMDPPAAGVADTIRSFRNAGIRTVMLTGDQRLTATSVARQLGLLGDGERALDGREVDRLSDDALLEVVGHTTVFSRISPEAKLRIVGAYQQRGEVVAMLGDGVNDAAALRKADVGVAMGRRGTDLAKEAADVILEDDRFATVAAAVEEGRVIFDNVRKFVFYLFSCNLAEILVMLVAGLAGLPAPLRPIQILWLNLLTDTLPALALAVEPGEPGIMRQPPRDPKAAILSRPMLRTTAGYGTLIAMSALGAFWWGLAEGAAVGRATTMTFMTLALAQILHLGNARSERPVTSPRRALANRFAVGAAALAVILQLLPVPALSRVLGLEPLELQDWLIVGGLACIPALVGQSLKWLRTRRLHEPPAALSGGLLNLLR